MPIPASAVAFSKLVEARTRLNAVSLELADAREKRGQSSVAEQQYQELKKQWDEAFHAFKQAVEEFSGAVQQVKRPGTD